MSGVVDMSSAFSAASNTKAASFVGTGLEKWNTGSVTDIFNMFLEAKSMNADLSKWDVSNVVKMQGVFMQAAKFGGNGVDTWNVAKVTNMNYIFSLANSLTSCNKRKIADAWTFDVFTKRSTFDDWSADACPVRGVYSCTCRMVTQRRVAT